MASIHDQEMAGDLIPSLMTDFFIDRKPESSRG